VGGYVNEDPFRPMLDEADSYDFENIHHYIHCHKTARSDRNRINCVA